MNLDFSEEQDMLREMIRGVCNEYCTVDVVREMEDHPVGYSGSGALVTGAHTRIFEAVG